MSLKYHHASYALGNFGQFEGICRAGRGEAELMELSSLSHAMAMTMYQGRNYHHVSHALTVRYKGTSEVSRFSGVLT